MKQLTSVVVLFTFLFSTLVYAEGLLIKKIKDDNGVEYVCLPPVVAGNSFQIVHKKYPDALKAVGKLEKLNLQFEEQIILQDHKIVSQNGIIESQALQLGMKDNQLADFKSKDDSRFLVITLFTVGGVVFGAAITTLIVYALKPGIF